MAHPADTCYHVLKTVYSGTDIQNALNGMNDPVFGNQGARDQSGDWIVIDCQSENLIDSYPDLANYVHTNYPSWITAITGSNPENATHANAVTLVNTKGASGSAWSEA